MISSDLEAKILRFHHVEKWPIGTIARHLGTHHGTVQRVLVQSGVAEAIQARRPSRLEPYLGFLTQTLQEYPRLPASRLYEMVRQRGYHGGPDHFRHLVSLHRPRPAAEAYLRLRTLRGEQAQVDWANFGTLLCGAAQRPLVAFVMVLSWSRQIFLRFFLHARLENFLRGHQAAFTAWGGSARVLLYDNLKSAVLERRGDAVRLHPTLHAFAGHYRFEPRPVAVCRGNEKGRVERAIQYIRSSFFAARSWSDLDDLNAQAHQWCEGIAADRRCPGDTTLSVREAFAQERNALLALPPTDYPTDERQPVAVGKTPYARFDGNDYSVPHTRVRRTLVVEASPEQVRLLDGLEVVATHPRSYGHHEQIEDAAHLAHLVAHKRAAAKHRSLDRLQQAAPKSQELFQQLAARGDKLGSATTELLRLLDHYGAANLEQAIKEALAKDSPHPQSVRLILERQERALGAPPSLPVTLPDDPRVRDLIVRHHDLASYDVLSEEQRDTGDKDEEEDQ